MIISITEEKILLKMFSICNIRYDELISVRLLYGITGKVYLWKILKNMEFKGLINAEYEHKKKYVFMTSKGYRICKALKTINDA